MTRGAVVLLSCLLAFLAAAPAQADATLQRYALIVGANFGGADRPMLKYGISDAERFARVMVDLGGVSPEHSLVLKQPKVRDLIDSLDVLTKRVTEAARAPGASGAARTEIVIYYSGHADEKGLLLGEDRYSYVSLRERLDQIPADVRIAVLDACASGAFTRIKGGKARPPFLVDQSTSTRGHAFLTSSAATEVAQESDRIRASYFTHYLVSGLRGAADASGDGRITLNEAYQFAFSETLGRTVDSRGGAQHPSYDISLSGTGDVVMTDVRQLSATLVLAAEVEGRFFVRNAAQELVVEVYKPYGRVISLGVEPGSYEVRVEREKTVQLAKVSVADGGQQVIDRSHFSATKLEPTQPRGDVPVVTYSVSSRNRIGFRLGVWPTGHDGVVTTGVSDADVVGGAHYIRYINEQIAAMFSIEGMELQTGTAASRDGAFTGVADLAMITIGVRWNPLKYGRSTDSLKPFVATGLGPFIGDTVGTSAGKGYAYSGVRTSATIGGYLRGGFDFHAGRTFVMGVDAGYNWMADFSQPVGLRDNYSGFAGGVSIGWLWGRGSGPLP